MKKQYNTGGISSIGSDFERFGCPLFKHLEDSFDTQTGVGAGFGLIAREIIHPISDNRIAIEQRVSVNIVSLSAQETLGL